MGGSPVIAPWLASAEITGFALAACDGRRGRVEDFVVEEECGAIVEILVALSDGTRVRLPVGAVDRIDWPSRTIYAASDDLLEEGLEAQAACVDMSGLARQPLSCTPD